jgi:hypothetical protein
MFRDMDMQGRDGASVTALGRRWDFRRSTLGSDVSGETRFERYGLTGEGSNPVRSRAFQAS